MQKLSKDEMKKVMGGVVAPPDDTPCDFGGCQWGANCFYQSGTQCGIAHCLGQDGYGNCTYTIQDLGDNCAWT